MQIRTYRLLNNSTYFGCFGKCLNWHKSLVPFEMSIYPFLSTSSLDTEVNKGKWAQRMKSHRMWTMIVLLHQVANSLVVNRTVEDTKPTERPQAHKIDNNNPYGGLPPVELGKRRKSVIFEPAPKCADEQVKLSGYLLHRLPTVYWLF